MDGSDGGIETAGVFDGANFDQNGDGSAQLSGWVDSDDGFLVFDRNGDAIISDPTELFGDQTILRNGSTAANGFEAPADFDGNKFTVHRQLATAFHQIAAMFPTGVVGIVSDRQNPRKNRR